jgi:hypothetical protein
MKARVAEFIARRWCVPRDLLDVNVQPLPGGLESAVALATVAENPRYPSVPSRFVVKELRPGCGREADVYERLWGHLKAPPVVRVLGLQAVGDTKYLYLEDVQPFSSWPWSDTLLAAAVCRELASLHASRSLPDAIFLWDYEANLAESAQATVELARRARDPSGRRCWRRVGDLRRVVAALPSIRSRLLSAGTAVIHGDMHPGNVILRSGHPVPQVALIDWGRARIGSPLEDVASWLHSLGCWEPQARRRHDTLMRAYLDSGEVRRPFTADLRVDYWFASVSNGLSGAIRYHMAVLSDPGSAEPARSDSRRALPAWERVVRRAAALLSTCRSRGEAPPSGWLRKV